MEQSDPIRIQMFNAIKYYNSQYHSTLKTTPIKVEEGSVPIENIYNNLIDAQNKRLAKHNANREDYNETRTER